MRLEWRPGDRVAVRCFTLRATVRALAESASALRKCTHLLQRVRESVAWLAGPQQPKPGKESLMGTVGSDTEETPP